jgi:acyl-CoA synthetase (AMP-forming)/AMP-acid ligase II
VNCHRRARRLASALAQLGIGPADRVGTLAWNTYRHLELYFAVSGYGAVLHIINPRLHPEQIGCIARHAQDDRRAAGAAWPTPGWPLAYRWPGGGV